MPVIPVTLIKGDKVDSRVRYGDALPENMYAVMEEVFGINGYMTTYPGLSSFGIGKGIDRGAVYNERFNEHYRVSGNKLISVSLAGVVTELGDIPGASQCRLKEFNSFNTQAIIADGKMFLYDPVGGFREIVDANLGTPLDGTWINGYYFLTDGEYIYHTDISDEEAISPLKFATAEFMPDISLGVSKTQDNKVVVWGRYSVEYFTDTATENFAFKRLEARAQKIGIVSPQAKCELQGNFYILGGVKEGITTAYKVVLGGYEKIATNEVDKIIRKYTDLDLADTRVECRSDTENDFVLYHLPNEVLCYNATLGMMGGKDIAWTILKTDLAGDNPYIGINGIYDPRNAKWLYGSKADSSIAYLDDSISKHIDTNVEWILYTPLLALETFSIDEIEIKTVPGFTTVDDARVALSLTFDGLTYTSEEWMSYGGIGEYIKRFIAYQLGYVPNFVGFKLRGIGTSRMTFSVMKVVYS